MKKFLFSRKIIITDLKQLDLKFLKIESVVDDCPPSSVEIFLEKKSFEKRRYLLRRSVYLIISHGNRLINDVSSFHQGERFNKSFAVNFNTLRIGEFMLLLRNIVRYIVSSALFIVVIYCILH